MDENAGWNDDYPMWEEPSDRFDRNQPPPYPEPHGPAGRGTSNDRGREYGKRRTWNSRNEEEHGSFENWESVWTPAWQRDQLPPVPPGNRRSEYRQSPSLGQQRGRAVPARLPEEPAVGPGKRSDDRGRRAGAPGQTSYQWAAKQRKHILSTRRGRIITAIVSACLLLGIFGTVGLAYAEYHHVKSQAAVGLTDLKAAEVDLKTLETNPFDTTAIMAAQGELTQANLAFIQMNDSIQHIPGVLGLVPIVGSEVDAVLQIGPIAVEATQAGVLGCQILGILAPKLKNPLSTSIAGLTTADIATIDGKFTTLYSLASTILAQVRALPPSATSLDPRLGPLLSSVSTNMPQFEQGLQDAKNVVAMLPQLLGVGKPANYLLEVMDSTELRPGGGFIGNFGDVTLSGGRMQGKPQIKDVDLLDQHYKGITLPSQFSWFTSGGRVLGFRDSNLDADFPSDAKRALQIYNYENGSSVLDNNSAGPITSFQGVIAVTPLADRASDGHHRQYYAAPVRWLSSDSTEFDRYYSHLPTHPRAGRIRHPDRSQLPELAAQSIYLLSLQGVPFKTGAGKLHQFWEAGEAGRKRDSRQGYSNLSCQSGGRSPPAASRPGIGDHRAHKRRRSDGGGCQCGRYQSQ